MGKKYVQVIVNNKSSKTDREYTYMVNADYMNHIDVGSKVIVPFGQGNKLVEAFVVDIVEKVDFEPSKIKEVKEVINDKTNLSKELVELCKWLKDTYMCQFIESIQCVMPTGTTIKNAKKIRLNKRYLTINTLELVDCTTKEKEIISFLQGNKSITEESINRNLHIENINNCLKELQKKEIITIDEGFKSDVSHIYIKYIKLSQGLEINKIYDKMGTAAIKQKEVISYLVENGIVEWAKLRNDINVSSATINALKNKGYLEIDYKEKYRDHYESLEVLRTTPPVLTDEQISVIESITPYVEHEMFQTFLIHGVTGSGKTEVYMNLVDVALKKNKEAIVLVPEISLASQMIERFKGRFGDNVAVLHSKLSLGERFDEWMRIRNGDVKIVIGARSAVFAPFSNLGIIIIDEEHEATYKSEHNPKYHTIEVAEYRCRNNQAVLILGSATPSLETYTKTLSGEYTKLEMLSRFNDCPLPPIKIVDMSAELKLGNNNVFSDLLFEEITKTMKMNKQVILFLNRRGYSTFVFCRSCGYVAKCENCDISLTYHNEFNNLTCHYCGYSCKSPKMCPACTSKYFKFFGLGTEKLELITKNSFPHARVARLDLDTTSKKGSMDKILKKFREGSIDIIIGTQMIAKGLDFPNVNLVGVISADTSLNLPDFRSAEKTFQLITQVAGRAGRGNFPGKVVIQTYKPEHYALVTAKNYDFKTFYQQEINLRKEFNYPPYTKIFNILFSGEDEMKVKNSSNQFLNLFKAKIFSTGIDSREMILGPQPASILKVKKSYRWQIIIKGDLFDQTKIKSIIYDIRKIWIDNDHCNEVKISIDINPYNML